MDNKLVSKENHEVAYCRKIARDLLDSSKVIVSNRSVKRIAKSYLKMTKGYSKNEKKLK